MTVGQRLKWRERVDEKQSHKPRKRKEAMRTTGMVKKWA